ncbi:MAG: hypothetical protein ABEJ40_00610 [Haloarculaceae archaeon]
MSRAVELVFGRSRGQQVVVGTTVVVYAWLVVTDPAAAAASARRAAGTFARLFTLVVASLLLASAVEELLPEEAVTRHLGAGAGLGNTVLAGLAGGALFGGPFATYPIMQSVRRSGAGYAALLAMYVGYGAIGLARVPFGLVVFSPEVVALRLAFAVGFTVVAAVAIWALVPERDVDLPERAEV